MNIINRSSSRAMHLELKFACSSVYLDRAKRDRDAEYFIAVDAKFVTAYNRVFIFAAYSNTFIKAIRETRFTRLQFADRATVRFRNHTSRLRSRSNRARFSYDFSFMRDAELLQKYVKIVTIYNYVIRWRGRARTCANAFCAERAHDAIAS